MKLRFYKYGAAKRLVELVKLAGQGQKTISLTHVPDRTGQ